MNTYILYSYYNYMIYYCCCDSCCCEVYLAPLTALISSPGRLLDAAQVLSRERCALLPAFLFLNLKSTALRGPGGSWRNEVEADFCARLVVDLKRHAKALGCSDLAQSVGAAADHNETRRGKRKLLSILRGNCDLFMK